MPEHEKEAPSGTAPLSHEQDERFPENTAQLKPEGVFSSADEHYNLQEERAKGSIYLKLEEWIRKMAEVFQ